MARSAMRTKSEMTGNFNDRHFWFPSKMSVKLAKITYRSNSVISCLNNSSVENGVMIGFNAKSSLLATTTDQNLPPRDLTNKEKDFEAEKKSR